MGLEAVLPGPQNALYVMLCYVNLSSYFNDFTVIISLVALFVPFLIFQLTADGVDSTHINVIEL